MAEAKSLPSRLGFKGLAQGGLGLISFFFISFLDLEAVLEGFCSGFLTFERVRERSCARSLRASGLKPRGPRTTGFYFLLDCPWGGGDIVLREVVCAKRGKGQILFPLWV